MKVQRRHLSVGARNRAPEPSVRRPGQHGRRAASRHAGHHCVTPQELEHEQASSPGQRTSERTSFGRAGVRQHAVLVVTGRHEIEGELSRPLAVAVIDQQIGIFRQVRLALGQSLGNRVVRQRRSRSRRRSSARPAARGSERNPGSMKCRSPSASSSNRRKNSSRVGTAKRNLRRVGFVHADA